MEITSVARRWVQARNDAVLFGGRILVLKNGKAAADFNGQLPDEKALFDFMVNLGGKKE